MHKSNFSVDTNGNDDAASITGMRSPVQPNTPSDIPTIRISSESSRRTDDAAPEASRGSEEQHVEIPDLEKPEIARADDDGGPLPLDDELASAFASKRLCERWLDNLFL